MRNLIILLLFPLFLIGQETKNYKYYSISYDSIGTKTCSYRLTKEMVQGQKPMQRRSFLKFNGFVTGDYTNTGYDRGHLLAANFMSFDAEAYKETFYMGNIAPMKPSINRQIWKYFENYEEAVAKKYGCIDTLIKVIYGNERIGKITIPVKFYKIISKCDGTTITTFEIENI